MRSHGFVPALSLYLSLPPYTSLSSFPRSDQFPLLFCDWMHPWLASQSLTRHAPYFDYVQGKVCPPPGAVAC